MHLDCRRPPIFTGGEFCYRLRAPGVLIAGVAVLGILGWVLIEQSKTVSRTVESVAPHAAKALPLLAL